MHLGSKIDEALEVLTLVACAIFGECFKDIRLGLDVLKGFRTSEATQNVPLRFGNICSAARAILILT